MSRKDTIIVAVLMNAGLLVLLFVSAIKSPKPDQSLPVAETPLASAAPVQPVAIPEPKVPPKKTTYEAIEAPKPAAASQPAATPAPIKAPTPAPEVAQSVPEKIKVKKGDSLDKLARRHGTTVDDLMRVNALSTSRLQIGQELILPEKRSPVPKPSVNVADDQFYVVKNGDNLWKIAIENHLKVDELLKLNNLDEKKAKRLRPGDKLRIKK